MTPLWRRAARYEVGAKGGRKLAWLKDRRGVSAVEFALIAPVMIVVFMGLSDLATATLVQLHVNHAAEGTADVAASEQYLEAPSGAGPYMSDMFTAASFFMTPYSSSPLNVRITDIYYDGVQGHNYGQVYWSCVTNGSTSTPSSQYSPYPLTQQFLYVPGLPNQQSLSSVLWLNNTAAAGTSVIVVETSYSFSSPSNFIIQGTKVMTSAYATIPRLANYVAFPYVTGSTATAPTATTTNNTGVAVNSTVTCNYRS